MQHLTALVVAVAAIASLPEQPSADQSIRHPLQSADTSPQIPMTLAVPRESVCDLLQSPGAEARRSSVSASTRGDSFPVIGTL